MSPLAMVTWAAVVVLVVGSVAIFIWFLFDVGSVLHGEGPAVAPTEDPEAGSEVDPPGGEGNERAT